MTVHDVVVLNQVFAYVEVVRLDLPLGHLQRLGEHAALERDVLVQRLADQTAHHSLAEADHDLVFQ